MALIYFDGFELLGNFMSNQGSYTLDQYLSTGYNTNWSKGLKTGLNGNGTFEGTIDIRLPNYARKKSGITSFLIKEPQNNSVNIGKTIFAVKEAGAEIVSIRIVGNTSNFPYYYVTYELVAGGVQLGTFNFQNWNTWERWAVVWDATGAAVTASLYREGNLVISGIGGQLNKDPITSQYTYIVSGQTYNWSLSLNGTTINSGYLYSGYSAGNFTASTGDVIDFSYNRPYGFFGITTGPNLTGDVITINPDEPYTLDVPAQSYTPDGTAHYVYFSSRIGGVGFDSVTIWDDPIADLPAATSPHWIQAQGIKGPTTSTQGDWSAYQGISYPNGAIQDRLANQNKEYGARVEVANSPLEVDFSTIYTSGEVLTKISGIKQITRAYATPALPDLKTKILSGETSSDLSFFDVSTGSRIEKNIEIIDPSTGLPWQNIEYAEELILDPDTNGSFILAPFTDEVPPNPDEGWIIEDSNSYNKLFSGTIPGVGNGAVLYTSQDGGVTLGVSEVVTNSSWLQWDYLSVYRNFVVPEGVDALEITLRMRRGVWDVNQTNYLLTHIGIYNPESVANPGASGISGNGYSPYTPVVDGGYLINNVFYGSSNSFFDNKDENFSEISFRLFAIEPGTKGILISLNFYSRLSRTWSVPPVLDWVKIRAVSGLAAMSAKTVYEAGLP